MAQVVPVRTDVALTTIGPDPDPDLVADLEARHRLDGPIGRWRETTADLDVAPVDAG